MRPPVIPSDRREANRANGRSRALERRGPGPWHYVGDPGEPAFQNGWANIGGDEVPTRFRLTLGAGLEIQCAVTGGDHGTVVFTLPAGYRPDHELRLAASDDTGGFVVLRVQANGDVSRGIA